VELSAATPKTLSTPRETVRAVVVVPAHDEELRIGRCLEALAGQVEVRPEEFEVIAVLDACEGAGPGGDGRYRLARLHTGEIRTRDVGSGPTRVDGVLAYLGGTPARRPLLVDGAMVRCADVPQEAARALTGVPAVGDGVVATTLPPRTP